MRSLISAALILLCAFSSMADKARFSDAVKASVMFRADFDPTRDYPHLLKIYLRLDNAASSDVFWVTDVISGIEAELFDAAGNPVPQPPSFASIPSNRWAYLLPFGSRLEWLISHGGISMQPEKNQYVLMVGGRGWLVPINSAESYSLRIRLRGRPWSRVPEEIDYRQFELLLDLPPAKLKISK